MQQVGKILFLLSLVSLTNSVVGNNRNKMYSKSNGPDLSLNILGGLHCYKRQKKHKTWGFWEWSWIPSLCRCVSGNILRWKYSLKCMPYIRAVVIQDCFCFIVCSDICNLSTASLYWYMRVELILWNRRMTNERLKVLIVSNKKIGLSSLKVRLYRL